MSPKSTKSRERKIQPVQEQLFEVEVLTKARIVRIVEKQATKNPKKKHKIDWEYLVKWVGYTSDDDSWEPESNLGQCREMLRDFWKSIECENLMGFVPSVGTLVAPSDAWIENQRKISSIAEAAVDSSGGESDTSDDVPLTVSYSRSLRKPPSTIKPGPSAPGFNQQELGSQFEKRKPSPTESTFDGMITPHQAEATSTHVAPLFQPHEPLNLQPMEQNREMNESNSAVHASEPPVTLTVEQQEDTRMIVDHAYSLPVMHLKLKGVDIPARVIMLKRAGSELRDKYLPEKLVVEDSYAVADVQSLLPCYAISGKPPSVYLLQPDEQDGAPLRMLARYLIQSRQAALIPIHDVLNPRMVLGHYFLIPFHQLFAKLISQIVHLSLTEGLSPADRLTQYVLSPVFFSIGCQPLEAPAPRPTLLAKPMTVSRIRATMPLGTTAWWKNVLRRNPLFFLGLNVLGFPSDMLNWLGTDPSQKPFVLWNDFHFSSLDASRKPSASMEARLESHLLSVVLSVIGMRHARTDNGARVLFVHAESLRHADVLSRLTSLKKGFEPATVTIYRYGSSCGIVKGVQEIYPCGGVVTFTPKALLEGRFNAMRLIAELHEHPLWSCYILPSTLGFLVDVCKQDLDTGTNESVTWVLNQITKRLASGHLSLITSAPPSAFCMPDSDNAQSRSAWLAKYLSAVPPTPARVRALSLFERARDAFEPAHNQLLGEISKDIMLMQQQPAIMHEYRRYVVVMGDSEAKEIANEWQLKDGAEWIPLSGFDFGDDFFNST